MDSQHDTTEDTVTSPGALAKIAHAIAYAIVAVFTATIMAIAGKKDK